MELPISLLAVMEMAELRLLLNAHGVNRSFELANMHASLYLSHTRLSARSHLYFVHYSNARINHCLRSFIPFADKLWNSLPDLIFFILQLEVLYERSIEAPPKKN